MSKLTLMIGGAWTFYDVVGLNAELNKAHEGVNMTLTPQGPEWVFEESGCRGGSGIQVLSTVIEFMKKHEPNRFARIGIDDEQVTYLHQNKENILESFTVVWHDGAPCVPANHLASIGPELMGVAKSNLLGLPWFAAHVRGGEKP